jgi:hypothetical protein
LHLGDSRLPNAALGIPSPSSTSHRPRQRKQQLSVHATLTMFVRALRTSRAIRVPARFVSTKTTSNQVPANDPVERDAPPNVSETNVTPTSSEGSFDKVLQEDVAAAEKMRTTQAPNYKGIWSRSQQPREVAMSGPRFEQSIMEDQVFLYLFERMGFLEASKRHLRWN